MGGKPTIGELSFSPSTGARRDATLLPLQWAALQPEFEKGMIYREIEAPVEVGHIVLCAWLFLTEPTDPMLIQHQVPPDGTTNLVLSAAPDGALQAWLVAPSLAARSVPMVRGSKFSGLRLRPEAAQVVTGMSAEPGAPEPLCLEGKYAPMWVDLQALFEGRCTWLGVVQAFRGMAGGDVVVRRAVDRLITAGGDVPVSELAADANLSDRQFRRRFRAATGIPPKQFADVQRVRHALIRSLQSTDWAGIAHASGFSDQPHFTRNIKDRFGAPPGQVVGYLTGIRHEMLSHGGVRIVQDAAQTLA